MTATATARRFVPRHRYASKEGEGYADGAHGADLAAHALQAGRSRIGLYEGAAHRAARDQADVALKAAGFAFRYAVGTAGDRDRYYRSADGSRAASITTIGHRSGGSVSVQCVEARR